jgi:hypothetical protein
VSLLSATSAHSSQLPVSVNHTPVIVLAIEPAAQVKPCAHKTGGRWPKRPYYDIVVVSGGKTRVKRVKPANNLSRPSVIETSDEEKSGTDVESGNKTSIAPSRLSNTLRSRSILGDPSDAHIADLTIESPPLDSSPKPSASSIDDSQSEAELPVMLDVKDIKANSDVQYQFTFQKSRSDPFTGVIKTKVEGQVSLILPR